MKLMFHLAPAIYSNDNFELWAALTQFGIEAVDQAA